MATPLLTAEEFVLRNAFFNGRSSEAIGAALDEAALYVSEDVVGAAMYLPLVEAKARVLLLSDQTGLPTSQTKESGLRDDAVRRYDELARLCPARMMVLGAC